MPSTHEFGILPSVPQREQEFEYEPEKYGCIFVHDDDVNEVAAKLSAVPTFFHCLARPEHGLAYHGITLIPPQSLALFQRILEAEHNPVYDGWIEKIRQAQKENRFLIHFGI